MTFSTVIGKKNQGYPRGGGPEPVKKSGNYGVFTCPEGRGRRRSQGFHSAAFDGQSLTEAFGEGVKAVHFGPVRFHGLNGHIPENLLFQIGVQCLPGAVLPVCRQQCHAPGAALAGGLHDRYRRADY